MSIPFTDRLRNILPRGQHPAASPQVATTASGDAASVLDAMNQFMYLTKIETRKDPLLYAAFGDFREHASYLTSNVNNPESGGYLDNLVPARAQKPFVKLMGEMHGIYRRKLTKDFSVELDKNALSPEARGLIQDLDRNQEAYKHTVSILLDKAKFISGKRSISDAKINADPAAALLIRNSASLCKALKIALDRHSPTIPLLVNGHQEKVANNGKIGSAIFILNKAAEHALNSYECPFPLQEYIKKTIVGGSQIPASLRNAFTGTALAERYDAMLAAQLPSVTAALQKGGHALQMMNLIPEHLEKVISLNYLESLAIDRQFVTKTISAPEQLLKIANLPVFPGKLETPADLALALSTVADKHLTSLKGKVKALANTALTGDEERADALATLNALPPRTGEHYDRYNAALRLARDYIAAPTLFTETVKRSQNPPLSR